MQEIAVSPSGWQENGLKDASKAPARLLLAGNLQLSQAASSASSAASSQCLDGLRRAASPPHSLAGSWPLASPQVAQKCYFKKKNDFVRGF